LGYPFYRKNTLSPLPRQQQNKDYGISFWTAEICYDIIKISCDCPINFLQSSIASRAYPQSYPRLRLSRPNVRHSRSPPLSPPVRHHPPSHFYSRFCGGKRWQRGKCRRLGWKPPPGGEGRLNILEHANGRIPPLDSPRVCDVMSTWQID
jgi:hypothetical protein